MFRSFLLRLPRLLLVFGLVPQLANAQAALTPTVPASSVPTATAAPLAPQTPPPPQPDATPEVPPPASPASQAESQGPQPFGHNLFLGNFLRTRRDGLNPDYVVMPGDRVSIQTWGAITLGGLFVVDGQGNLFLPEIGPIHLAGVRNADLTSVVEAHIKKVYVRHFGVYTNLLTARPVAVFVTGSVRRPGSYAGVPSDTVLFFLDQAGGIEPALGSYRNIEVLREGQSLGKVDLYEFVLRGALPTFQFKDGDTILVHRRGPQVTLSGDVALSSLVELQEDHEDGAAILAVVPKEARANEVTWSGIRSGIPFQRTLSAADFSGMDVRDGDRVVLRDDGRPEHILVNLSGEFEGPSTLSVPRGTRLIDFLNHVEVNASLSNPSAVHLLRTSVAKAQKEAIEDSLFRLERSALLALSSSNGEADIRVKEAELMQKFAERARLIDPLGRVVTARGGQQHNMLLEDGDTIVIPGKTGIVRVGGEVQMAYAAAHRPGMTAEEYILAAGGFTDRADVDRVLVIHANAEVETVDPDIEVYPGDEILVLPRVDSKTLQNAMDISQVVYQIAVAAGVVLRVVFP